MRKRVAFEPFEKTSALPLRIAEDTEPMQRCTLQAVKGTYLAVERAMGDPLKVNPRETSQQTLVASNAQDNSAPCFVHKYCLGLGTRVSGLITIKSGYEEVFAT